MILIVTMMMLANTVQNGSIIERTPYEFPFASHAEWLGFMNGKGLEDWSILFDQKTYDRLKSGKTVSCEKIRYASDGLSISGFLITPQKEGSYPTIIFNRGGTAQWARLTFWDILEMCRLAERGYVVVASYLRGVKDSEGKPELGAGDIQDTLNLLPLIDAMPKADNKRIGMWGFSRGGITTYMTLTKTDRIAAAAVIGGSTDSVNSPRRKEFETHVYPGILAGFKADPNAAITAISAVMWAEKLPKETPLLILHGSDDDRVSALSALNFAERLQTLKKNYRLVMFEGGSHSLAEHYQDVRRELDRWFDRHLKQKR